MLDLALLRFDYAGVTVEPDDPRQSLRRAEGNRVVVTQRHAKAERAAQRPAAPISACIILARWRAPASRRAASRS